MNPAHLSIAGRSTGHSHRQTIGEILLQSGKLTHEEVELVSDHQKKQGLLFGEAAQSLGLVEEADVRSGLAKQFDYDYVQPGDAVYPVELVAAYEPYSSQVEAMRSVRSDLLLGWFNKGHKSLAVISLNPGDGNSFFTANLGLVFSQIGKRTLLVDANLRSPRMHQIFGLPNKAGLTDMLVGRPGESIACAERFSHLYVLTAGTPPPNPQELLSQSSFDEVHKDITDRYDVTLVDTSAFGVGADALMVAAKVGGVLLTIRKNRTKLTEIDAIGRQLLRLNVQIVGSVLVDF